MRLNPTPARPTLICISLKMYFGVAQTAQWCEAMGEIVCRHPATTGGLAHLVVLPSFLSIPAALEIFANSPVGVGGQNLWSHDDGAFTGEVSGAQLREIGCTYVEVGHAERRTIFGDSPDVVSAKVAAAMRNELTPVVCVGEALRTEAVQAARECAAQLRSALTDAAAAGGLRPFVVAYEPLWAIGAEAPAAPEHIIAVCDALDQQVAVSTCTRMQTVIYGGTAGPGLLTELGTSVGGLFLGRRAHRPAAVADILDEVLAIHGGT